MTEEFIAIEIPVGEPQIEYSERGDRWTPRGSVLRCVVENDAHGEACFLIDDRELTCQQFGRLLRAYAGWGMRIVFVPAEAVHEQPLIEVRDPDVMAK